MSPKKETVTMEALAGMVQQGFVQMNERFDIVEKDIAELKTDVADLKVSVRKVERVVDDIQERMVEKMDFEDMSDRVTYIEDKIGIVSGK